MKNVKFNLKWYSYNAIYNLMRPIANVSMACMEKVTSKMKKLLDEYSD